MIALIVSLNSVNHSCYTAFPALAQSFCCGSTYRASVAGCHAVGALDLLVFLCPRLFPAAIVTLCLCFSFLQEICDVISDQNRCWSMGRDVHRQC